MKRARRRWKTTCRLYTHPASVPVARVFAAAAARLAGFDSDAARDIQVAVAEAVGNAYLHAYGGGPEGQVELDIDFDGAFLTIEIHDSGRPVAPGLSVPRELPPPGRGGRGLYLIGRLMDTVEIHQPGRRGRGTLVVMKKRVPPAPHEPARS